MLGEPCSKYATDADGFYLDICVPWLGITLRLARKCNGKKQTKNPTLHRPRCADILLAPAIAKAREIFGEASKGIPITTLQQLDIIGDSLREGCVAMGGGVHQALSSTTSSAAVPVLNTVFFLVVVVLESTDGLRDSIKKKVWHGYASGKLSLWVPDVPEAKAIAMAKELHNSMPGHVQALWSDVGELKRDFENMGQRVVVIEEALKKLQESPTCGLRRSDPATAAIGTPVANLVATPLSPVSRMATLADSSVGRFLNVYPMRKIEQFSELPNIKKLSAMFGEDPGKLVLSLFMMLISGLVMVVVYLVYPRGKESINEASH